MPSENAHSLFAKAFKHFQLESAANKIQKQLHEQHCCQMLFEQSAQKGEKKLEKLTNEL